VIRDWTVQLCLCIDSVSSSLQSIESTSHSRHDWLRISAAEASRCRFQMEPAISELAVGGGLSLKLQHHPDPLKRDSDGVEVTGSALWDAGLALGLHLRKLRRKLGNPESGAHLAALEIGAGCGTAGLALALGSDEVELVLTDNQPEVLSLLEANVRLNRLQGRASVQELDWNNAPPLAIARRTWDVIIAADVVYGLPSFGPLLQLLETLCHNSHTRILIACGNRQRGSREDLTFFAELRERNKLEVMEVIELEGACVGRWGGGTVEVMMLRRQPSTEREGQEAEDAEFEELMRELDQEDTDPEAQYQQQPASSAAAEG
jgi:predicted nicotinamide N-methyase